MTPAKACEYCHYWGRQSRHLLLLFPSLVPPWSSCPAPFLSSWQCDDSLLAFLSSPLKRVLTSSWPLLLALTNSPLLPRFLWKSLVISCAFKDMRGQWGVESLKTFKRISDGCIYGMCKLQAKE